MAGTRQQVVAVLCTSCLMFCVEASENMEEISQQEITLGRTVMLELPFKDIQRSETNQTDEEFMSEMETLEILEAKLRSLTVGSVSPQPTQIQDSKGNLEKHIHNHVDNEHSPPNLDHAKHDQEDQDQGDHDHANYDHADHDHADQDYSDQDHADHDHPNHDHADHDHADHDHANYDHADHDHADKDHSPQDHANHDHADHDHADHDHTDQDYADHDHANHGHADQDHDDHNHVDDDHADQDHADHNHADHDHGDQDYGDHDHADQDHPDHNHADQDNADQDHADHDHANHDHPDQDHPDHNHADNGHADHDNEAHDHADNDHANHEHSAHIHDHEDETKDGNISLSLNKEEAGSTENDGLKYFQTNNMNNKLEEGDGYSSHPNENKDEESDSFWLDWLNAVIGENEDDYFNSNTNTKHGHSHSHNQEDDTNPKSNTQHKQDHNIYADETSTESTSHHDHSYSAKWEEETLSTPKLLSTSVWVTSLGTIGVISLVVLGAVSAIPLLKGSLKDSIIELLMSLAIGTLLGDAFIHLLPHALETSHGESSSVWKGFVATMTIIGFFVVDQVMRLFGYADGHSHGHQDGEENSQEGVTYVTSSGKRSIDFDVRSPNEKVKLFGSTNTISNSAKMVIVGDAIHNFANGLALGASFSISIAAGFSASMAVLCHELPREMGDFALLLHTGMATKTAVFFNILSSIFTILGMVAGLLLKSTGHFSSWLLAATVGVVLYVALVSMMSQLGERGIKNLILNIVGMVAGAVLLLIIGLYEHDLVYQFGGQHH